MQGIAVVLIALLFGSFAGYLGYYSIQSLRQASLISRPVPVSMLKDNLDRDVSVSGTPEALEGRPGPMGVPVLWYRMERQEYRRSGKSGGWRTMDTYERDCGFLVHFHEGGRVVVSGRPTEVHGGQSRTDGGGFFACHGMQRTIHKWMPLVPVLTVMGRLGLTGQGATIAPSRGLGLLISASEPSKAALEENAKGIAGLVASAGALVLGIALIVAIAAR